MGVGRVARIQTSGKGGWFALEQAPSQVCLGTGRFPGFPLSTHVGSPGMQGAGSAAEGSLQAPQPPGSRRALRGIRLGETGEVGKALPSPSSLAGGRLLRSLLTGLYGPFPSRGASRWPRDGGGRASTRSSLFCRPTAAAPFGRREAAASTPSTAPRWPTVSPTRLGAAWGAEAGPGDPPAPRLWGRQRGIPVTLPCPRPSLGQGTPPIRAAPCPAWTASPASWTVSPRRRNRGCPSVTPTPCRPAPAWTRGRRRPGRRCPDGPTRRYEGPEGAPPRTLLGRERQPRSPLGRRFPLGLQAKRPAGPRPGVSRIPAGQAAPGSGHTRCPGIPAANKTCCERALWPAGSLVHSLAWGRAVRLGCGAPASIPAEPPASLGRPWAPACRASPHHGSPEPGHAVSCRAGAWELASHSTSAYLRPLMEQ